eukprot:6174047-Pleurochrysis_carterae.AAC.3
MAEPACGRAGAMFCPLTIPLNIRRGSEAGDRESGGRADGWRRQGVPRRDGGLHWVHPPDRHEGSGRGGCPVMPGAHRHRAQGRRGGGHR